MPESVKFALKQKIYHQMQMRVSFDLDDGKSIETTELLLASDTSLSAFIPSNSSFCIGLIYDAQMALTDAQSCFAAAVGIPSVSESIG